MFVEMSQAIHMFAAIVIFDEERCNDTAPIKLKLHQNQKRATTVAQKYFEKHCCLFQSLLILFVRGRCLVHLRHFRPAVSSTLCRVALFVNLVEFILWLSKQKILHLSSNTQKSTSCV